MPFNWNIIPTIVALSSGDYCDARSASDRTFYTGDIWFQNADSTFKFDWGVYSLPVLSKFSWRWIRTNCFILSKYQTSKINFITCYSSGTVLLQVTSWFRSWARGNHLEIDSEKVHWYAFQFLWLTLYIHKYYYNLL